MESTLLSNSDQSLIENLAHTRLADCYQCGKCTAGCPMGARMDSPPTRLMRLLQIGEFDRALRSEAIWECVSCETCTSRCPKSVDCCAVMDALRQISAARDLTAPSRRRVLAFQKAFLASIRRHGRLNEIELTATFKLAAFLNDRSVPLLFQDALLAPELRKRGKLRLAGGSVKDRGVVERIFERCANGGAQ